MRRPAAIPGLLCATLLFALVQPTRLRAEEPKPLTRAEFQLAPLREDPPRPPLGDAGSSKVSLPDRLGRRAPRASGVAWYRFALPTAVPNTHVCGLYLAHAHANAVVYLEGSWLGQGGRFREPSAHTWGRPLYFTFPCARSKPSGELWIGLQANGGLFNALDAPVFGADQALRPRYERALTLRVSIAQASTWISLTVCLLFAALAISLREATYALLAVAALCNALTCLNYHWLEPPLRSWAFNTLVNLGLMWMGCALGLLGFLWVDVRPRWLLRGTLGLALFCGFWGVVLDGPTFDRAMVWLYAVVTSFSLAGMAAVLMRRDSVNRIEWNVYAVTSLVMVGLGVHDMALHALAQDGAVSLQSVHSVPYLGLLMVLGAGGSLLCRFLRIYRRADRANLELERDIKLARADLALHYERVRELESQQILAQERERMKREMHDGVGGHLVAAIASMSHEQPPEVLRAVRAALDDLRLVVHALEPATPDLGALLAHMRTLLEPRLSPLNLRFRWEVAELPVVSRLGPFELLQVMRILQESVTNVLKHARASVVTVRSGSCTSPQGHAAFVEISDDGCGICADASGGYGMNHMAKRARRIGALLAVDSTERGTSVRLTVPVKGTA